jgi:hypothetical protein
LINQEINIGCKEPKKHDHTNNYDLYVDKCMKKWAYFSEKNLTGGLGYSTRSVISKIMEYGFLIQSSTGSSHYSNSYEDDEVEEVEAALSAMAQYNPKLAKIIILRYLYKNNVKNFLAKEKITYDVYKKGLQIAKVWMAAALRGKISA